MDAPQNNRRPPKLKPDEQARRLAEAHPEDTSDVFATDGNTDISELGRLALRAPATEQVDYYIALGDLCALRINEDGRLLIYYTGKALLAYQRAIAIASDTVDKSLARRALDSLVDWLVEMTRIYPTPRNIAVALWAIAPDDASGLPAPNVSKQIVNTLLAMYRGDDSDEDKTMYGAPVEDEPPTMAAELDIDALSEASATRAPDSGGVYQSLDSNQKATRGLDETRASLGVEAFLSDVATGQRDNDDSAERFRQPERISAQHEFDIGDMIENRYEVADVKLGGMGVVYLCYDHDYREPVAIKSFQEKFLTNERAVARFEKEAVTWIQLDKHPHIVQAKLVRNISTRPHIILE
ncbi:MAG: hypothetical protein AAFQ07_17390, partial [Chloroflexota bacterium]